MINKILIGVNLGLTETSTSKNPHVVLIVSKLFRVLGDPKEGLIVGLGGGGLAMFLHQHFKQVKKTNYTN